MSDGSRGRSRGSKPRNWSGSHRQSRGQSADASGMGSPPGSTASDQNTGTAEGLDGAVANGGETAQALERHNAESSFRRKLAKVPPPLSQPGEASKSKDSAADESGGCALSLIFDMNPSYWDSILLRRQEDAENILNCIMTFVRTHLLLNQYNHLAFILNESSGSTIIYTSLDDEVEGYVEGESKSKRRKKIMRHTDILSSSISRISHGIKQHIQRQSERVLNEEAPAESSQGGGSTLSSALGLGLCFIHRARSIRPQAGGRILCVSASKDVKSQYLSINNKIFCAENEKVMIDACVLMNEDSAYLKQAAFVTKGIYLRCNPTNLLSTLMSTLSLDVKSRRLFKLPIQTTLDGNARCLCHDVEVDSGYLCPVCMRFCYERMNTCKFCKVRRKPG